MHVRNFGPPLAVSAMSFGVVTQLKGLMPWWVAVPVAVATLAPISILIWRDAARRL